MAAGNYLGLKSHIEVLSRRLREERRNVRERPHQERQELVEYYRRRGFTEEEIEVVVPATMRNPRFLMEEMAVHELGICPGELSNPLSNSFWIFAAYVAASVIPVLPYILFERNTALGVSISGTVVALFGVGAARTVVTGRNWVRSGLEMLAIAAMAGAAGYLAGHIAAL